MTPDNQSDQSPVHQFVSTATGTLIKLIAIKLRAAVANGDTVLDLDPHPRQSTKFEAQSKPGMSVHAYLTRVITLTPIPADAVLLSLVYLNRISSPGSLNEDDRPSLFSYLPKDLQDQYDAEATVRNFDQDTGTSHQDERSHESDQGLRNQSTAPSCQPQTPLLSRCQRENSLRVPINSLTIHRLILSTMVLATKFVSDGYVLRNRTSKVGGVSESEMDGLERETMRRLKFELCWKSPELDSIADETLGKSLTLSSTLSFLPVSSPLKSPTSPSLPSPMPSLRSSSSISPSSSSSPSPSSPLPLCAAPELMIKPSTEIQSETSLSSSVARPLEPKSSGSTQTNNEEASLTSKAIVDPVKPRQPKRMIFVRSQLVSAIYDTKYLDYYCQTSHSTGNGLNGGTQGATSHFTRNNRTSLVVTKLEQNCLKICHTKIYSV